MNPFLATVRSVGGGGLVLVTPLSAVDPGFGTGAPPVDPDFGFGTLPHPGHGLPGYGHPDHDLPGSGGRPGNALPTPPVKPSVPIVLPPGVWPPKLPPQVDNSLPGVPPDRPVFVPPDPDVGISQPIALPSLPPGVSILIALPDAMPKEGAPANAKPAILYQGAGTRPVLVYVSAAAVPK